MWLIFCDCDDRAGLWLWQELRRRAFGPLELITMDTLGASLRWEHRIGRDGVSTEITLADGRKITSASVRGVINRLTWLRGPKFNLKPSPETSYCLQEWQAFFSSWLFGLPGVVMNRPSAIRLDGSGRSALEWLQLAAEAGFAVPASRYSSHPDRRADGWLTELAAGGGHFRRLCWVGGTLCGANAAVTHALAPACARLAHACGAALLGLDFAVTPAAGEWRFVGASEQPDLQLAGAPAIDALIQTLSETSS